MTGTAQRPDRVVEAAARAAMTLCAARLVSVFAADAQGRLVLAVHAAADGSHGPAVGQVLDRDCDAVAYFVLDSGQSLAVAPVAGSASPLDGLSAVLGRAVSTALTVPCLDGDAAVAVLVLADRAGDAAFGVDELEVCEVLAGVVGAAVGTRLSGNGGSTLDGRLAALAAVDSARHRRTALAIGALLDD